MGYYQDKKAATAETIGLLQDNEAIKKIYLKIQLKYGFGKSFVDNIKNITVKD